MRFRSAARVAMAISGRRAANHSTLLQLHPVPGRIADYGVEPAVQPGAVPWPTTRRETLLASLETVPPR